MSFITQASSLLSFLSIPPTRSFAGIKGYVTLSESTVDSLEITQQPVQQGAMISDHAFKKPISLAIQMQFSMNLKQDLKRVYQSLLVLQAPIPPSVLKTFTVTTPKRSYRNMMLATVTCTTDKKTENVLSISATFTEVIIVPVLTTNVPASQLKNPANNSGTQKAGHKSALLTLAQGIGAAP